MAHRNRTDKDEKLLNEEVREQLDAFACFVDELGKYSFSKPGVAKAFAHTRQPPWPNYGNKLADAIFHDATIIAVFEKGALWANAGKVNEAELTDAQQIHLRLALPNINTIQELEKEIKEIKKIPPDPLLINKEL